MSANGTASSGQFRIVLDAQSVRHEGNGAGMPFVTMRIVMALLILTAAGGCTSHVDGSASVGAKAPPDAAVLAAADATREDGRYGEAQQIYQRLLLTNPGLAGARYGAAECALALGQPDNAAALFDGLVANPVFHAKALQGKGLAQFALGQRDAADRSLRGRPPATRRCGGPGTVWATSRIRRGNRSRRLRCTPKRLRCTRILQWS